MTRPSLHFLGRMAHDSDFHTHGAKGGDWLMLTAGHRLSQDKRLCVAFLTPKAAAVYLRRLPSKLRETLCVMSMTGALE